MPVSPNSEAGGVRRMRLHVADALQEMEAAVEVLHRARVLEVVDDPRQIVDERRVCAASGTRTAARRPSTVAER